MKDFLISKYGEEEGTRLSRLTDERFEKLLGEAKEKSKQQMKVFKNLLLPRIALYKVLLDEGFTKDDAMNVLEDHMVYIADDLRNKYAAMDKMPFAYSLFKFGFTHIVPSSDLWDADIGTDKKDEFSVTMHRCFWKDTFDEYDCPELCKFACQCDEITYGDLKHIEFLRTETLGTGGNTCDFVFRKRK